MSESNVQAVPMAKKSTSDSLENDMSKTLTSTKITSEIDFLKRMKLKAQIAGYASATDDVKAISNFESADDKRVQNNYVKLIKLYNDSESEKRDTPLVRTKRNELSNIYSVFGFSDLYSIASTISEIERVRSANDDILSVVKSLV